MKIELLKKIGLTSEFIIWEGIKPLIHMQNASSSPCIEGGGGGGGGVY